MGPAANLYPASRSSFARPSDGSRVFLEAVYLREAPHQFVNLLPDEQVAPVLRLAGEATLEFDLITQARTAAAW